MDISPGTTPLASQADSAPRLGRVPYEVQESGRSRLRVK